MPSPRAYRNAAPAPDQSAPEPAALGSPVSARWSREERGVWKGERRDDEGAIEPIIALLAARLGDQKTAVASGAVQMHRVVLGARIVLGAYRVVRAQPGLIERR